tara:strand:+ start:750 stop:1121 length:372 start_codon:yes stop_codon:yes gene_type:complete
MADIILMIILSVSIRVANDFYSPKHFLITYINGQTEEVMIGKGLGDYFCPSHCNISHAHLVRMCDSGRTHTHDELAIHPNRGSIVNKFMIYNGEPIRTMEMVVHEEKVKGIEKLWVNNKKGSE